MRFAGGNQLSGNNISITANNDINHIYLNDGSGKGVNNSLRAAGTVSYAGGVGVSVAQGSESSYGFQGVFTYNKIKNDSHADIKNVDITANALVNSSSDDKNAVNAYNKNLTGAGLDVSGDSYSEFAKVGDTDSTQKSIQNQSTGSNGVAADDSVGYKNSDYGNKIITGALAISDVDNDFKAEVTNSTLNIKNKTDINATSNTLDINAAAGAAVSSKGFGAGGSVSWQTTDNQVVAGVAVSGTENALNGSVAVNHGSNSTQAVLDNVKSNAVNNLNVNATDSVKKIALVGGLTIRLRSAVPSLTTTSALPISFSSPIHAGQRHQRQR